MRPERAPRKGDHVFSRRRWDEKKQPNGTIVMANFSEGEYYVRFHGEKGAEEFLLDELTGNKEEIAGKTWWIIGFRPTPDEVAERMKDHDL